MTTKRRLALGAMLLWASPGVADEIYFKSPGPGMRFTEGVPLRVYADVLDSVGWWEPGWPKVECFWDGGQVGPRLEGNAAGVNYFEFTVPAPSVTPGSHNLRIKGYFMSGAIKETSLAVPVDPWPTGKDPVNLTADATISNLNWTNKAVRGNGHTVTVSGALTIRDSLITGVARIQGTVSGLNVQASIFEGGGALALNITGGPVTVKDNEFRANNTVQLVASDPDRSPIIDLRGSSAADPKLFQGNRVALGRVVFTNMTRWLVGGDTDAESNVLMGPRCTIELLSCPSGTVRGNYARHNYRGGWSQGFNFVFAGSSGLLVEHNLIRGGSWPLQNAAGEFRYNVVVGYGHEWVRTAEPGTRIHHNVFVPEDPGGLNYGFWAYHADETDLHIVNNTFDGGGPVGDFAGPFVGVTAPAQVAMLRNNLFTFARDQENGNPGTSLVWGDDGTILYADYNAFYSPDSSNGDNYDLVIPGTPEGQPGFAGHDVGGVNGRLSSTPFAGVRWYPYDVDEGAVWNGALRLSQILANFRARYTPAAGSPVINAGDPADNDPGGRRADIGAIDRDGHDADLFGRWADTIFADGFEAAP